MAPFAIALITITALLLMSKWANKRFKHLDRIPMQWGFDGRVNWNARRHIALAFTPVLGGTVLLFTAVLTVVATPRAGQDGYASLAILLVATIFITIHGLHLWLVNRADNQNGS